MGRVDSNGSSFNTSLKEVNHWVSAVCDKLHMYIGKPRETKRKLNKMIYSKQIHFLKKWNPKNSSNLQEAKKREKENREIHRVQIIKWHT